jgi:hypothetical protein
MTRANSNGRGLEPIRMPAIAEIPTAATALSPWQTLPSMVVPALDPLVT